MGAVVAIHSFRRGVGKTSLASSLAVLPVLQGKRVALVDTDFQSPGIHSFFGLSEGEIPHAFDDYLRGRCDVLSAAHDVTRKLIPDAEGRLFVLPAVSRMLGIMQGVEILSAIERYAGGLEKIERELSLDLVLVDSPAGLEKSTLQTIAFSSAVILVLRADKNDYQGTAVAVDTIRNLKKTPAIWMVLNDAPESLDSEKARRQLDETYCCGKSLVLKHSEELQALSSSAPFALKYPFHPVTAQIGKLAELLLTPALP